MATRCVVTDIAWERVNLTITVSCPGVAGSAHVEFNIIDQDRTFPVVTEPAGDGRFLLKMNITNFLDRKQIPNGSWRFVPVVDGKPRPAAGWDLDKLDVLDERSRNYLYAGNRSSYTVTFGISEDDYPEIIMRTYQMSRGGGAAAVRPPLAQRVQKRVLPKSRAIKLANIAYRLFRRISPPKGNRILFASEQRARIEGNLLRIRDRMIERGLDARFDFSYSFRAPQTGNKWTTFQLVKKIATSDVILIDDYFGLLENLKLAPRRRSSRPGTPGAASRTSATAGSATTGHRGCTTRTARTRTRSPGRRT